ncbi:MAG TPA: S41 family peptidase [Candidatus Kapabacteria bacterium]|nr:S41 family peptidase [Candidatus Kapabacteria bacterium]
MLIKKGFYIIATIFLIASNTYATEDSLQKVINLQASKFKYMLENAAQYHKDSIDIIKSSDIAFHSLLNSFDKNSEYYPKSVIAKLNERNKGVTVGIGIDVFPINDTLTIVNVAKKSPSEEAGLQIGDQVLFINDEPTSRMNRSEVMAHLSGDTATKVSLIIKAFANNNFKPITIERKLYESYSVASPIMFDNKIAYIAINRFSELTGKEFADYASKIKSKKPKCIIVDLRGNTGGYLLQAVEVADQFLPDSLLICETIAKADRFKEKFYSKVKGEFEKIPLIILVDSISASGSEILAAAIQDYDRGLIIGTQTYGKATAQRMINLVDSTAFKLTVAEYRTPLGRRLQKETDSIRSELDESADVILGNQSKQSVEEMLKRYGGVDKLTIYKTKGGRSLFSPWGILPDIFVHKDTSTALTNVLRSKGLFLEWAFEYYQQNKANYKDEFANFEKYKELFQIDDLKLELFKGFCINKKIWNNEMFQIDKSKIAINLKSVIAFVAFGAKESNEIMLENDIFVKTALQNLEKAELMFKNNGY